MSFERWMAPSPRYRGTHRKSSVVPLHFLQPGVVHVEFSSRMTTHSGSRRASSRFSKTRLPLLDDHSNDSKLSVRLLG